MKNVYDNSYKPGNQNCPHCPGGDKYDPTPIIPSQCTLNKPLLMVIPPGGIHISCPAHPEGHHIFGQEVTC